MVDLGDLKGQTKKGCGRLYICLHALKRRGRRRRSKAHCFPTKESLIDDVEKAGMFIVPFLHRPLCPRLVGLRSGIFLTRNQERSRERVFEQLRE